MLSRDKLFSQTFQLMRFVLGLQLIDLNLIKRYYKIKRIVFGYWLQRAKKLKNVVSVKEHFLYFFDNTYGMTWLKNLKTCLVFWASGISISAHGYICVFLAWFAKDYKPTTETRPVWIVNRIWLCWGLHTKSVIKSNIINFILKSGNHVLQLQAIQLVRSICCFKKLFKDTTFCLMVRRLLRNEALKLCMSSLLIPKVFGAFANRTSLF